MVGSGKGKDFIQSTRACFDISINNLEQKIASKTNLNCQEDFKFYKLQLLVPQVGTIGSLDKKTFELEERRQERERAQQCRVNAEQAMINV